MHQLLPVLRRALPSFSPSVVFDVGANVGQSLVKLREMFPAATVHCFEPAPSTYQRLSEKFGGQDRVVLYNIAISSHDGTGRVLDAPLSPRNRLSTSGAEVTIRRLDGFCRESGIGEIGYLKIDTEGHDLEVLEGLGNVPVSMIECEVSANRYNRFHVPFEDVSAFLYERGFSLFVILEQCLEFQNGGRPLLRRFNPVFINNRLVGDLSGIKVR